MLITSIHNPKIKTLIKLYRKSSYRNQTQSFVVEGAKEIAFALESDFICNEIFIKEGGPIVPEWEEKGLEVIQIAEPTYKKVAYRYKTEESIGVFKMKAYALEKLELKTDQVIIILDQIEKPGNIGAILRTCDALGVKGMILCDGGDLYNPNTIRSSVGCVFHVPVYQASFNELLKWLTKNQVHTYVSHLKADTYFDQVKYQFPAAIVVGNESNGVRPDWKNHGHQLVKIPMKGINDSLNVSVAAALLLNQMISTH